MEHKNLKQIASKMVQVTRKKMKKKNVSQETQDSTECKCYT